MCICLLFCQTIGYFMVKNLLLLWIFQLFQFAFPADLYQWITVSSGIQSYQRHLDLSCSAFLYLHNLCGYGDLSSLCSGTQIQIFFLVLTQEHALWFIIYWYHKPHPEPLWDIRTPSKFSCFQDDASLQTRTINAVQQPAVTEYFLFRYSYIL